MPLVPGNDNAATYKAEPRDLNPYFRTMASELSKGVALVTGAAQGIGRGIALRLADDGFDVAINDITSKAEALALVQEEIKTRASAKGHKISTLVVLADVSKEDQVEKMVGDVVKELGGLDVMVANAGVCLWTSILETTAEEWDRHFAINAKGTFFCYKHAAKQMIKQGRGGRIIGASSAAGKQGFPNLGMYSATKFAVRGLTHAAAREWGPHKITVNAYAPGMIDTPLSESLDATYVQLNAGVPSGAFLAEAAKFGAVGYLGKPEDVAGLVSYLASKEAHFVTGQNVSINGGTYLD
ncbi:NAD-binding protein [Pluteus cervinus]|uniref:NAD-binding protein n=1 Tax=Pluteus cervinus TaxID=181527 RepID=A0ACD3AKM4_9AGAR|nr:NAD-binding protein [Pluteus cervinus]